MTFRSVSTFKCDGCKVIEAEGTEVTTDIMQARPPLGWLRVELHKLTRGEHSDEALDVMGIKHYCPHCTPLVENYLKGREEEKKPEPDSDEVSHAKH
jgi:DNA-directed RNA polymerase subunit N (RpoN/RPB10)